MSSTYTNNLKQTTNRFTLPVSGVVIGGWKDYDKAVLSRYDLDLKDKVAYLNFRLRMILLDPMDNVFDRKAPHHNSVNGDAMSFAFVGTTIVCCSIDALGGFVLAKLRGNKKRFKEFLRLYMKDWAVRSPDGVDVSDWLWKNLRNGLAHSLIIEEGGLEDLKTVRFRDKGKGHLDVHAEILYTDLKLGIKKYFSDVVGNPIGILAKNFEIQFKEIFQTF